MSLDEETRRCLLELAYDVLPDDEAAGLLARIEAEPVLAQAYAESQQIARLLSEAARVQTAKIEWKQPASSKAAVETTVRSSRKRANAPLKRTGGPGRRHAPPPWTRAAIWGTWLVAACLLVGSLAGYWYHRGQLADISAEHLWVTVTGPARVRPGAASQYTVTTSAVTGEPVSAQIEFTLTSPDGQHLLMGHKEQTDEDGGLLVTIPAEEPIPSGAELKIVATYNDKVEQLATRLVVEPLGEATELTTDKPVYRPGETIRYRAVTLACFELTPDRPLPIRFEILDPQGTVVAGSQSSGLAKQGTGCGTFLLSPQAAPGTYTLIARSGEGATAEQRLSFIVRAAAESPSKQTAKPADKKPANLDTVDVRFCAEGGNLVAGLENRVYFLARDPSGKPLHLVGRVVDDEDQDVATVETTHGGMGVFQLEPRAGETYRLRIETPAGIKTEPQLPETVSHPRLVLTTGSSLFEPDEPLEFNIRSIEDGLPLVAAAYCRGVLVGHQALAAAKGANEVAIDLHPSASGAIRVCVFDYSESPPRRVAERLVYRRPSRQLLIRAEEPRQPWRPGQKAELSLRVTDETGKPAQATLGVGVVDQTIVETAPQPTTQMLTGFLLGSTVKRNPALENADYYLTDDKKAGVALDLLLATQGCQRPADQGPVDQRKGARVEKRPNALAAADPAPPAVFDNLLDLRKRYQESLNSYRTSRTQTLSTLITWSFFGGAGLLLLATMLTLMNVAVGLWLWIPVVISAGTCLSVGVILISPETLRADSDRAVAFVPFSLEPQASEAKGATAKPAAAGPAPTKPFDACPYQYENPSDAANASKGFAGTLYWNSLLQTDAQGRATIQFDVPSSVTTLHLRVDAHAAGRIGSLESQIRLQK